MTLTRNLRRFGDTALICETEDFREGHRLADAIEKLGWKDVEEVVVGHRSLTLVADPRSFDFDAAVEEISCLTPPASLEREPRQHLLRVEFNGPDLQDVAAASGLGPRTLVEKVVETDFEVAFLGFAPGFAYLAGLPPGLSSLARRSTPRTAVPAGSLAIGGGFAAVYPQRCPGGWHLLGTTDTRLFDPGEPPYAVLWPGDRVHFEEGDVPTDVHRDGRATLRASGKRHVEVLHPGLISVVEDLGRIGMARIGVPHAGAADPISLRLSNRLVGNDDNAAAIEVSGQGPTLVMSSDTHVAVVGEVVAHLDGTLVPLNTPLPVRSGQVLRLGRTGASVRAYVAFGGGIDLPPVLGSRSSDMLSDIGPGPLEPGDLLGLGPVVRPRGRLVGEVSSHAKRVIRVVPGPDVFAERSMERLVSTTWEVAPQSDRVGIRIEGPAIQAPSRGIPSRATVTGAIQVPGDGTPIVLMCDHATLGGYPVIATVIRADLGLLGQVGPGSEVRFELIDLGGAKEALRLRERELDQQIDGWYPVRSD